MSSKNRVRNNVRTQLQAQVNVAAEEDITMDNEAPFETTDMPVDIDVPENTDPEPVDETAEPIRLKKHIVSPTVSKVQEGLAVITSIRKQDLITDEVRSRRLTAYMSVVTASLNPHATDDALEVVFDYFKTNQANLTPDIILQGIHTISRERRAVIELYTQLMLEATTAGSLDNFDLTRAAFLMGSDKLIRFLQLKLG